jgi:hypothetical protein
LSYKTNAAVLHETISSAVEALGAGKILPEEMPISKDTNLSLIRYAPDFAPCTAAVQRPQTDDSKRNYPYTIVGLAKFLGMVKSGSQTATSTDGRGMMRASSPFVCSSSSLMICATRSTCGRDPDHFPVVDILRSPES